METTGQNKPAPVFFLGHGNPMNAVYDNKFTRSLLQMGRTLKIKPGAILVISAHWLTKGSFVSTTDKPETIYDFYGFPDELYKVVYPAPGASKYAKNLLKEFDFLNEDKRMGLDHGAWSMLVHMFPEADIPVFQLSIDFHKPLQYHFELGKKLIHLREKNILIIGSGNIVHNLRYAFPLDNPNKFDWAYEFDEWIKDKIVKRDFNSIIDFQKGGKAAEMSVPTTDHFIPLLYTLGLAKETDEIKFTYEEIITSLSMRCIKIG
ncbi:MAG: 4,5-DOPA dioxygenase extradiol [Ignavibacteriae bacterium]|nr:4,5-DOPA dioxygenase extradiol [Ignavibacteriota bacterium]